MSNAISWINKKYDIREDHNSKINLDFELDTTKSVTVIVGGSGTGKTTLLKKWFNVDDVRFEINSRRSIFELLAEDNSDAEFERVSKLLFDVGLSSVPIWKNSYYTLSNGEKLRFEIAYKLNSENDIIFIDEYTSMLDRQTAHNLSMNLNKLINQYNKRAVLATAHYDILDWIDVDQVVDTTIKKHLVLPEKKLLTSMNWRLDLLNETGGTYLNTIII